MALSVPLRGRRRWPGVPDPDRWAAEGRLTDDDFGRILDT